MMDKVLQDGIVSLVEFAKENDKVFVFGNEVYNPEEALDVMLATAEEDMDFKEWSIEQYLTAMRELIF